MGASEWVYFVPYQPDIQKAFEVLQAEVFEELNYDNNKTVPFEVVQQGFEIMYSDSDLSEAERISARDALYAPYLNPKRIPLYGSIKEMLEASGEDGTGTILDIRRTDETAGWRVVAPLSSTQLLSYFGTDKPTRTMVNEAFQRKEPMEYWNSDIPIQNLQLSTYLHLRVGRGRGKGTYIIIYKDGEPDEILFTGFSGD